MRILPCSSDRCRDRGNHLEGVRYPVAMLQSGPYTLLRFPVTAGPSGLKYTCARCKRANRIRAQEFASLPELTLAQLQRLKLAGPIEKDLQGAGLTRAQIDEVSSVASLTEILENR